MELLVLVGALVSLDLLAGWFGYDSRDGGARERHRRAVDAIRLGDHALYASEMRAYDQALAEQAQWSAVSAAPAADAATAAGRGAIAARLLEAEAAPPAGSPREPVRPRAA